VGVDVVGVGSGCDATEVEVGLSRFLMPGIEPFRLFMPRPPVELLSVFVEPVAASPDKGALYDVEVVGLANALPIGTVAVDDVVDVLAGAMATLLLVSGAVVVGF